VRFAYEWHNDSGQWYRSYGNETETHFEALRGYLEMHGCPVAFYSDKHTVFRVAKQDTQGGHGITQFGRAAAIRP